MTLVPDAGRLAEHAEQLRNDHLTGKHLYRPAPYQPPEAPPPAHDHDLLERRLACALAIAAAVAIAVGIAWGLAT